MRSNTNPSISAGCYRIQHGQKWIRQPFLNVTYISHTSTEQKDTDWFFQGIIRLIYMLACVYCIHVFLQSSYCRHAFFLMQIALKCSPNTFSNTYSCTTKFFVKEPLVTVSCKPKGSECGESCTRFYDPGQQIYDLINSTEKKII